VRDRLHEVVQRNLSMNQDQLKILEVTQVMLASYYHRKL
jgi:hypothetical protein